MHIEYIPAKTIISGFKTNEKWFGNHYNMNIYKGCNHGCIYCDSRSDCYHIDNFDKIRVKDNAVSIIEEELRKKRKTGIVATGAMSDPYNYLEKDLKLTRQALELINKYHYGITIATKSDLIIRVRDILSKIKEHSPTLCKITITTADDTLCKIIEPNVSLSSERFSAVKALSEQGIFTGVLLMPVLPFITDSPDNIKQIVRISAENGAKFIYCSIGMTLRSNQRIHYYEKLDKYFPRLKERYILKYGDAYMCGVPEAKALWQIFKTECKKYNLLYKMDDIIRAYQDEYKNEQLTLF